MSDQGGAVLLGGRYALSADTRTGAQATVTQAYDTRAARLVAIKRIMFGPHDERARDSFQREAAVLRELRHPNIVALLDVDRDEAGDWYLVLEWVPETLHDVIAREGALSWSAFWERFGRPLLDGVVYAQKMRVAHRDIKPKNILVTEAGTPKLADYGIAKLLDTASAWAAAKGHTFRFDYTPGYTPEEPDQPEYSLSRDCYAFAAVAVSCIAGRHLGSLEDLLTALQEIEVPAAVRRVLERCLAQAPAERPPLASVVASELDRALADLAQVDAPETRCHLSLGYTAISRLETALDVEGRDAVERFVLDELGTGAALLLPEGALSGDAVATVEILGVTWRLRARVGDRRSGGLEIFSVSELGAALVSELKERSLQRPLSFTFAQPSDPVAAHQALRVVLAEACDHQREEASHREAQASQRVFRVWRSYLRDRADLEAKRANAIRYIDRRIDVDRVVFTTEIAQGDDIIGQERVVEGNGARVSGVVANVSFNQVTLDVTYGDVTHLPRRGQLAINTIAAQRALAHQSAALDAVFYGRTASSALKAIILDPRSAHPVVEVTGVEPVSGDLDAEKLSILSKALGVQDILAIEGPPGTGKTTLITEIVVQWLSRHPGHRILLSSQTHIALDNVLERVAEVDASLDMIRIGRPDEPRISEFSRSLLLERRVDAWIAEVRRLAEEDMQRWAREAGVDHKAVAIGMRVERLLQILARQEVIETSIADQLAERAALDPRSAGGASSVGQGDEEEATEIDSEVGAARQMLRTLTAEAARLRAELKAMGDYAAALSQSRDPHELAEWATHFLPNDDPTSAACRERLALLEEWQLRVGRSSDFNAAMLSSAQIIAGTCVGIAGVKGMEQVGYDLCIIDEASKATATEMLIPMVRSRRWIVVGDPKQLPPFFEEFGDSLLDDFDEREVRATLFDRLLDEDAGLPKGCREGLRNQYRMIEPIGDLVSDCFYGGKLKSPVKTHGVKLAAALPKPVTWYSTHALPSRGEQPDGQTFHNPQEVAEVRTILLRLQFVAKAQRQRLSVAVIAGYTAQVRALGEMVSQGVAEWPDLAVLCNSVDAFQGRQADVCIYSVVRSNNEQDLGFLRERPRLNVALSRGKSALVIVGDAYFCRRAEGRNPFKRVIKFIDEHEGTCVIETCK